MIAPFVILDLADAEAMPDAAQKPHPKVEIRGGMSAPGDWKCADSGAAAPLGDQAESPRSGDGFGAVGRAQLVKDVADVFLDGVEGHDQTLCDVQCSSAP